MSTPALAEQTEALVQGMQDPSWIRKVDTLRLLTALLASDQIGREATQRLSPLIVAAACDRKWEVRKAAAHALAELRYLEDEEPRRALAALVEDSNRWVSQAATRASRRLRARNEKANDWALTEDTRNPTLQLIMQRIREIGLRSMTPARIYDLAIEVGEHFYRELAADTAHETRTLLTPLKGYLLELGRHLAGRGVTDPTAERYLSTVLAKLKQLESLLEDLQVYSSPNDATFILITLDTIIKDALTMGSERTAHLAFVTTRLDVPSLMVEAVPVRLARALSNLFANAYQAMPNGGTLEIRARSLTTGFVELIITDTGHGMTAEQIGHAMERFRTTRRDEGGTGLGLPIAQRIIEEDHQGSLAIESAPGEGTKVVVVIPARHEVRE